MGNFQTYSSDCACCLCPQSILHALSTSNVQKIHICRCSPFQLPPIARPGMPQVPGIATWKAFLFPLCLHLVTSCALLFWEKKKKKEHKLCGILQWISVLWLKWSICISSKEVTSLYFFYLLLLQNMLSGEKDKKLLNDINTAQNVNIKPNTMNLGDSYISDVISCIINAN